MATYEITGGPWKGCIIEGKLDPSHVIGTYDMHGTFILYIPFSIIGLHAAKSKRKAWEKFHARGPDWVPMFDTCFRRISPYQAARKLAAYNKANPETNWRLDLK